MLGARIAALLRSHGWVLNLVFIALGAYFVAGAMNSVLARSIRVVPNIDDIPVTTRAVSTAHASVTFTEIANRNLMALKRENLHPVEAAANPTDVLGDTFTEEQLRPCTMAATPLRATLVAEGAPEWSIAILLVNNEPTVFSTQNGRNQLSDDAKVVDIRERAVVLRRRDHFELCQAEEKAQQSFASTTPPPPPMASEGAASEGGGGPGVTKVSDTQFNVDRAEVSRAFDNLSEVATQARIVPSFKNGKANGFKLFSIKPGSIYSKIGLQNGDVIQKINGYEMNSPDKALEIYSKLKDASSVTIDLQRRGQTMTMNYTVGG